MPHGPPPTTQIARLSSPSTSCSVIDPYDIWNGRSSRTTAGCTSCEARDAACHGTTRCLVVQRPRSEMAIGGSRPQRRRARPMNSAATSASDDRRTWVRRAVFVRGLAMPTNASGVSGLRPHAGGRSRPRAAGFKPARFAPPTPCGKAGGTRRPLRTARPSEDQPTQ